jgi:hypothetical protein
MSLDAGGHLTHGFRPNVSGKMFHQRSYGTDPDVVKAAAELVALRNWQLELDDARAMAWSPEPQTKAAAVEPPSFGVEYGDKPHRRISDKAAALSMVLSRRRVS